MKVNKKILAFGQRETVLNITADELEARGMPCIRRYGADHFPDDRETWNEIGLVLMDPSAGYACMPEEWRSEVEGGSYTGIVLLEKLVPEGIDRAKIPIVLRSTVYTLGLIRDEPGSSPAETKENSTRRLEEAGYREIHFSRIPAPATIVASEIERILGGARR